MSEISPLEIRSIRKALESIATSLAVVADWFDDDEDEDRAEFNELMERLKDFIKEVEGKDSERSPDQEDFYKDAPHLAPPIKEDLPYWPRPQPYPYPPKPWTWPPEGRSGDFTKIVFGVDPGVGMAPEEWEELKGKMKDWLEQAKKDEEQSNGS